MRPGSQRQMPRADTFSMLFEEIGKEEEMRDELITQAMRRPMKATAVERLKLTSGGKQPWIIKQLFGRLSVLGSPLQH